MKTDSLFYQLFKTYPALVFELMGDPSPRTSTYGFASQEVKQTSFRIDGILLPPPYAADLPIVFVEVQGYRDKFPNLTSQEIQSMFGLSELKQTRVYQEALEEGLQQGKQEEALAIVLRLLTRRLGTVEPELQSQIQQLSSAQIEDLAEALLDFSTTQDLVAWLQIHQ